MLTRTRLVELYKEMRDVDVLSVYVDGDQTNPADRRIWHTTLERGLSEERRRIEAHSPSGVAAFDAARDSVMSKLDQNKAFLPGRGWVGFATADGLAYAEGVAVPMPDLVRWELGVRVAPYVRALKQNRVVVAALADRRKARIFTYRNGETSEHIGLVADLDHGELHESAASKRAGTQTGSRGETGTDAGQRALEVSTTRMHAHLLEAVADLAGNDGFVVFGGTSELVAGLARQAHGFSGRYIESSSMHAGMSESEVQVPIEAAASALTRQVQDALLDQVLDAAGAHGRGCLGVRATKEALRDGRVDALLLTRGLREQEPDLADHLVGAAFEQGAVVEELSEAGAARLDQEGEGVGARLRYA